MIDMGYDLCDTVAQLVAASLVLDWKAEKGQMSPKAMQSYCEWALGEIVVESRHLEDRSVLHDDVLSRHRLEVASGCREMDGSQRMNC